MVKQIIYFGAPGTGKSYAIENLDEIRKTSKDRIFRTTFHPEYSYSDFVGQILPVVKDGTITYDFQPGVFTEALKLAYSDLSKPVYLIIEEMSRGNVAAIFGDIFQLLDRNDRFTSRYPIRNSIIASEIIQLDNEDEIISLPANFNIFATLNTSDQNVYAMDTAFKRRFEWKYIPITPVLNEDGAMLERDNVNIVVIDKNQTKLNVSWHDFYMTINKFITDRNNGLSLSEDKQIGQFFIQFSINMSEERIKELIQNKLLQYLWQDIELAAYGSDVRLFSKSISNFSDLFYYYENEKCIFSKEFLELLKEV